LARSILAAVTDDEQELPLRPEPERLRVELPTSGAGSALAPGVDLDDTAALLDLMERDELARGFPELRPSRPVD
jgi:hypothetical protein